MKKKPGKRPVWANWQELQLAIDAYFAPDPDDPDRRRKYTLNGLALHLGYSNVYPVTRPRDYFHKAALIECMERARLRIAQEYEEGLSSPFAHGSAFALKSLQAETWNEKYIVENTGNAAPSGPQITIIENFGSPDQSSRVLSPVFINAGELEERKPSALPEIVETVEPQEGQTNEHNA